MPLETTLVTHEHFFLEDLPGTEGLRRQQLPVFPKYPGNCSNPFVIDIGGFAENTKAATGRRHGNSTVHSLTAFGALLSTPSHARVMPQSRPYTSTPTLAQPSPKTSFRLVCSNKLYNRPTFASHRHHVQVKFTLESRSRNGCFKWWNRFSFVSSSNTGTSECRIFNDDTFFQMSKPFEPRIHRLRNCPFTQGYDRARSSKRKKSYFGSNERSSSGGDFQKSI